MIATYSPRSIENVTPRSARTFSSPTVYVFSMSTISISIAASARTRRATRPCRSRRRARGRSGSPSRRPSRGPGSRRNAERREGRARRGRRRRSSRRAHASAAGVDGSQEGARRSTSATCCTASCVSEASGSCEEDRESRARPPTTFGRSGVAPDREELRVAGLRSHRLRARPRGRGRRGRRPPRRRPARGREEHRHHLLRHLRPAGRRPPAESCARSSRPASRSTRGSCGPCRSSASTTARRRAVATSDEDEAAATTWAARRAAANVSRRAREGPDDRCDRRDRGPRPPGRPAGRVAHLRAPSSAGDAAVETARPSRTTFVDVEDVSDRLVPAEMSTSGTPRSPAARS